jgi:hypothetical protein
MKTIKNKIPYTFLLLTILFFQFSCSQNAKNKFENHSSHVNLPENKEKPIKTGKVLFNSILDTLNVEPINEDVLLENDWLFKPFDNCISYFEFNKNGKGTTYNCEMDETNEINFSITNNRLIISEFEAPHVNNPENIKIKSREDIFVFNGKALIMVGSKMYNINGNQWEPEIEFVIEYEKISKK